MQTLVNFWLAEKTIESKLFLDEMIEGEIVAREMEAYISQARFQIYAN